MTLPSSLVSYLESKSDWSSKVGQRFYPVQGDEKAVSPWVTFRFDNEDRDYAIDGPAELLMADISFRIYSNDYMEAHSIAKVMSEILDGYRGVMGDVVITHIYFVDLRDSEPKDEILDLYCVICKISVWYKHVVT